MCQKLNLGEIEQFEAMVLRDFLLKSATETIGDSTTTFEKKIRVMDGSFDSINALGENAPKAFIDDVSSAFLSLLFSDKEDVSISDSVRKVFRQAGS